MQKLIPSLLFLCMLMTQSAVFAQDDSNTEKTYNVLDYMKVKPGEHSNYLKVEKAWKKLHQANIDKGNYDYWVLNKVIMPIGDNEEYNYVVRTRIKGEKALASYLTGEFMNDDWKSLLTEEEIEMVMNTSKYRTMVKSEVWSTIKYIDDGDMSNATINVFNYFKLNDNKRRKHHFDVEMNYWQPLHQAKINSGEMKGWVLSTKEFPYGSNNPMVNATVDIFKDMEQYLNSNIEPHFDKIYPNMEINDIVDKSRNVAELVRSEVRQYIDSAKKEVN